MITPLTMPSKSSAVQFLRGRDVGGKVEVVCFVEKVERILIPTVFELFKFLFFSGV